MHRFFRQLPTVLAIFEIVCMHHATSAKYSQYCWANNVVTCCVRLHGSLYAQNHDKVQLNEMFIVIYGLATKVENTAEPTVMLIEVY